MKALAGSRFRFICCQDIFALACTAPGSMSIPSLIISAVPLRPCLPVLGVAVLAPAEYLLGKPELSLLPVLLGVDVQVHPRFYLYHAGVVVAGYFPLGSGEPFHHLPHVPPCGRHPLLAVAPQVVFLLG